MRKLRDAARAAWEAAVSAAKNKATELQAKSEVTAEDQKALDDLIAVGATKKAEFDRLDALCKQEDQVEEQKRLDTESAGRKTRDNRSPGILPEGSRNSSSRPLKLTNIFRATFSASGGHNQAVYRELAPEEHAMSEKLKAAGYHAETLGGWLFPLGEEFLIEPVNDSGHKLADFTELRREVRERLPISPDPGEIGWLLKRYPQFAAETFGLERKDLALGDDTLGGYLVPATQAGRVIDLLRNRSVLMRSGAMEFSLPPSGNLTLPRLTADPAFTYTDPDTTTDLTTSNIGTGVVRLMAKSLRGAVTIPNDLIRYSTPSVELLVRSALASKAAIAEDFAFLENPGSSIAPKGLLNYPLSAAETPAINKLTLHVASTVGANGDTFEPEDIAKILALFYMGNDPDQPTGWIMRPLMWAAIQNRRADAAVAGDKKGPFMFWTDRGTNRAEIPQSLGGFPVFPTMQTSNNRVKGSGTNLVYILFGNFRRMMIGRGGVIELAVSEHVKFLQDKTIIRAILRSDMGLEHEESFVLTDTLLES